MDLIELKLCDIQGRLFELSNRNGLDSNDFVKHFMKSEVAKHLDSIYCHYQWAGEEYLLDVILEEKGDKIKKSDNPLPLDAIYWIGYIYRYWHYYKNESSERIYKQAPFKVMKNNYAFFHTMEMSEVVDNLKEIYIQKKS